MQQKQYSKDYEALAKRILDGVLFDENATILDVYRQEPNDAQERADWYRGIKEGVRALSGGKGASFTVDENDVNAYTETIKEERCETSVEETIKDLARKQASAQRAANAQATLEAMRGYTNRGLKQAAIMELKRNKGKDAKTAKANLKKWVDDNKPVPYIVDVFKGLFSKVDDYRIDRAISRLDGFTD